MLIRSIQNLAQKLALDRGKMLFLSGPRQSGKTTLAKQFLGQGRSYFTWEDLKFRREWSKSSVAFTESLLSESDPILVLDEIHKNPRWKNELKGVYDVLGDKVKIIVTGSALLNSFRKGSDSLIGRFIHFHLMPFSLGEILRPNPISFLSFLKKIQSSDFSESKKEAHQIQVELLQWGGFPEVFLAKSKGVHSIWTKNRLELLVRQDLRDTSPFLSNNQIEVLASILPDKVGSPFSRSSIREDLEISHTTVTRWLNALESVYYHYSIPPYSHRILRSLKKEPKVYLYDWSTIESPGPRFENMVASHLLKMVYFYNDTGQADLSLYYLRNKEKQEVDFLLTNKRKPICMFEVKLSDIQLDKTYLKFQEQLSVPHFQIVNSKSTFRKYPEKSATVIGFDRFFHDLP